MHSRHAGKYAALANGLKNSKPKAKVGKKVISKYHNLTKKQMLDVIFQLEKDKAALIKELKSQKQMNVEVMCVVCLFKAGVAD